MPKLPRGWRESMKAGGGIYRRKNGWIASLKVNDRGCQGTVWQDNGTGRHWITATHLEDALAEADEVMG